MTDTVATATQAALDAYKQDRGAALERLKQLLAIPSVSTDPAFAGHVRRAAELVAAMLREAGLSATVHPTKGHPVVLARSAPEAAPAGAPHVLFYGHYDVQPPDPLDRWTTPPFEPTVRDGRIYARGAVDDKGQVCTFLEALRAWHRANAGKLPVHVTALIEGEEECGSPSLRPFLEAHADDLAAPAHDIALISDTAMWEGSEGKVPAVTYGLRGLQYFDIQLQGPSRDLHSGIYGGAVPNPATILTEVLGRVFDKRRRVTIPGFYDDVVALTPAEKRRWAKLGFDEAKFLGDVGVAAGFGESGYSTLARRWARPSCDINGLFGGYDGPGAKTVIPSFAGAKISFRLVPNQSAEKIAAAFEAWLAAQDVHGCRWKVTNLHGADPVMAATDSPWIAAAERACRVSAGRAPVLVREGGSIPVCIDLKRVLGLDSLLVGFGLNDDCVHSPNEKFDLECFDLGCRTHIAMLAELSRR